MKRSFMLALLAGCVGWAFIVLAFMFILEQVML